MTTLRGLHSLAIRNFGILGDVEVRLERLNVLVGPNGSGKSTLLDVIDFLGDAARSQLADAVEVRGGLARLRTRGQPESSWVEIEVRAVVTAHAHENALDEYALAFRPISLTGPGSTRRIVVEQSEQFRFKRTGKQGRRITLKGGKLSISDSGRARQLTLDKEAFGLAVLPHLGKNEGAAEVRKVQELFTTFRVFDVDAEAARRPAHVRDASRLRNDASNLAAFLAYLATDHRDAFSALVEDARAVVPGLADLRLRQIGGADEAVAIDVVDHGLPGATPLADGSFGTVRALALLAMLYDPKPPLLTCVEEIDHGLHPHVFDRLVDRLREASARTQFLIATHSPALVNRLRPSELIVCERDEDTGLARIPAIDPEDVQKVMADSPYGLGEIWFSGTLGGVPK
ncbi:MAG: AAA family ATPase [Sandaracinaceae bacterium]